MEGSPKKRLITPNTKLVPLWKERFGWACVVSWNEMWKELPPEINEMIINYLIEKYYKCMTCESFVKEYINNISPYCSRTCWENRRGYTFFGHSDMIHPPRMGPIMNYTSYFSPFFVETDPGVWETINK